MKAARSVPTTRQVQLFCTAAVQTGYTASLISFRFCSFKRCVASTPQYYQQDGPKDQHRVLVSLCNIILLLCIHTYIIAVVDEGTPPSSKSWRSNLRTSFQVSWRLQERQHPTHQGGWRWGFCVVEYYYHALLPCFVQVQIVEGALLHSKKNGDGYVDTSAKLEKIFAGVEAALK